MRHFMSHLCYEISLIVYLCIGYWLKNDVQANEVKQNQHAMLSKTCNQCCVEMAHFLKKLATNPVLVCQK